MRAAGEMRIIVNGQALQLDGAAAYTNGPNVMLPLRETAEALKYKITYTGSTGTFQLNRFQENVGFRVGGQEVLLDEKNKVAFTGSIELKQKRAYAPLSLFSAIGLVTSYDPVSGQVEIYMPEVTSSAVAGLLATGNYEGLWERFFRAQSDPQLSQPVLLQSWEGITAPAGNYLGVKSTESRQHEGGMTITSVLLFSKSEAQLTLELDTAGKISKLSLAPLQAQQALANPPQ